MTTHTKPFIPISILLIIVYSTGTTGEETTIYDVATARGGRKTIRAADVIQLNVGGELMTTTRATLTRVANSTLARMFSGRWESQLSRDQRGYIFLDFNPIVFRHLLEQLRSIDDQKSAMFYPPRLPALRNAYAKMLRKLRIEQPRKPKNGVVQLNVAGQVLTTRQKIYARMSNYTTDLFVDADPQLFRQVVNELRLEQHNETIEEDESASTAWPSLDFDPTTERDDGICRNATWNSQGITVAGGNGQGSELSQLDHPMGLFIDDYGSIYVADTHNHRVMKWRPRAARGDVIVEATDRQDSKNFVSSVVVDRNETVYFCNRLENRIERWFKKAEQGEIILSNISCWGLALDRHEALYVSGHEDHRVIQWPSLEVVAGGNGEGSDVHQLSSPYQIFVDNRQAIYIADYFNHRIIKWPRGAKEGILVAGGNGYGDGLDQLKLPHSVVVDRMGTMYIVDFGNDRILRWFKDATSGVVIIGQDGTRNRASQLSDPYDIAFDREGNLYVADTSNHRIQMFRIDKSSCAATSNATETTESTLLVSH